MDASSAEQPIQSAISYPTIEEWATAYELQVPEALDALRRCLHTAYGTRVGLLDRDSRRYCLDLHRLVSVLDQVHLLGEGDVVALSYRCPARMGRYDKALIQLIARALHRGAPIRYVLVVDRVHKAVSRIAEEVATFYQGLS